VPDVDIAFVWMGARYRGMFGHRGITHSVAFAVTLAAALVWLFFRREPSRFRVRAGAVLLLAGLSHPFLDASMASGVGVALLAPFSAARYHSVFRPIRVTPPTGNPWLDPGGIRVTNSEIVWIWVPSLLLILAGIRLARWRERNSIPLPAFRRS
jgi:inner membrane protein